MLNHKDKYIHFQLYQQSENQKIYIAEKKSNPEEQVLVNVLLKAALVQPVDVSGVINATHGLEMLEEDSENWYFITRHLKGEMVFSPTSDSLGTERSFDTGQFLELMNIICTYDYLTPYYQMMLLKESQFILHNSQLTSREVFDLSFLPADLPDFTTVKTQVSAVIAQAIHLLKIHQPETYAMMNWQPLFEKTYQLTSLKQIATFWSKEVQDLSNRLQPEVLENLYAVKSEKEIPKGSGTPQKNYNSLQPSTQPPEKKRNLAILLTCALAFCLIVASFTPSILNYFNSLGEDQKAADTKSSEAPTNSNTEGTTPSNSTDSSNTDTTSPSPETELLIPDEIKFLSGLWAYDKTQFHTGDRSLKLTLNVKEPRGKVQFSKLSMPQNPSFSLWMRTDKGGNLSALFSFYKDGHLIETYKENLNIEAGEQWYLMNPISTTLSKDVLEADTLEIQFSGDVTTLWLDDLLFESFK